MNEEIKSANTQSSLAGGGINEEERQWQIKKAEMKKKYHLMSIALIAIIIVAGIIFAKNIWTGWISSGGNRYYYIKGEKVIGLATIENKRYFFDDSGAMQTGWQNADGNTYYFSSDGVMQTGWQTIDGSTYYFNNDGIMQTGFQTINGNKYYLGDGGVLHTGWLSHKNQTYYCSNSNGGKLATGKWTIDGENYYFNNDGVMATGSVEIKSGDTYYFDENGHFLHRIITQKNVPTAKSEAELTFKNKSGGNANSHSRELDSPIENCLSLTIVVSTTAVDYGSGDGERQVYIHTLDGKWIRIGFFNISNDVGEFSIIFDEPTSFDAFICPRYEGKAWSGSISQELKEVTYCSYDFGTNVKSE